MAGQLRDFPVGTRVRYTANNGSAFMQLEGEVTIVHDVQVTVRWDRGGSDRVNPRHLDLTDAGPDPDAATPARRTPVVGDRVRYFNGSEPFRSDWMGDEGVITEIHNRGFDYRPTATLRWDNPSFNHRQPGLENLELIAATVPDSFTVSGCTIDRENAERVFAHLIAREGDTGAVPSLEQHRTNHRWWSGFNHSAAVRAAGSAAAATDPIGEDVCNFRAAFGEAILAAGCVWNPTTNRIERSTEPVDDGIVSDVPATFTVSGKSFTRGEVEAVIREMLVQHGARRYTADAEPWHRAIPGRDLPWSGMEHSGWVRGNQWDGQSGTGTFLAALEEACTAAGVTYNLDTGRLEPVALPPMPDTFDIFGNTLTAEQVKHMAELADTQTSVEQCLRSAGMHKVLGTGGGWTTYPHPEGSNWSYCDTRAFQARCREVLAPYTKADLSQVPVDSKVFGIAITPAQASGALKHHDRLSDHLYHCENFHTALQGEGIDLRRDAGPEWRGASGQNMRAELERIAALSGITVTPEPEPEIPEGSLYDLQKAVRDSIIDGRDAASWCLSGVDAALDAVGLPKTYGEFNPPDETEAKRAFIKVVRDYAAQRVRDGATSRPTANRQLKRAGLPILGEPKQYDVTVTVTVPGVRADDAEAAVRIATERLKVENGQTSDFTATNERPAS